VGVQGGAKLPKDNVDEGASGPTPHWRLKEFGSEKMAAEPFMRPAGEQAAQAATDEFIEQFGRAIDRALKRAG
jgi:HK97 gp10 family phage protein